MSVIMM